MTGSIESHHKKRMNSRSTQYLIIRYIDEKHPHLICINRVDNYINTISDSNEDFNTHQNIQKTYGQISAKLEA